ncbi:FHA domain-containing protein [Dactylosporangium sp. NPDC000521]|uniref:FHA domain-containing protein n=1 Tax=Dactylosporangium sp. NPDC000521 TaxID=3363975 RepID=UPI00368CCF28
MAAVTWVCPVPDCTVRRDRPGQCRVDLVPLVREQIEPPPGREPEPRPEPEAPPSGLALDCPWGQMVDIPGTGLEIGRSAPSFRGGGIDAFDQVSRVHARLLWQDGQLHILDLHSANGTFVDGVPVGTETPTALKPGQQLRLGLDVPCQIVQLNEYGEPT